MTIFAAAMTSGVLLALATHALSGRVGVGIASVWQDLFPTNEQAVRSAFGWWLIAGAGFAGSFAAGLLARARSAGRRPRLGALIGCVFFLLLAAVPYLAAATPARSLPFALAVNLAVFALGTVTAFCGSWFAMPR